MFGQHWVFQWGPSTCCEGMAKWSGTWDEGGCQAMSWPDSVGCWKLFCIWERLCCDCVKDIRGGKKTTDEVPAIGHLTMASAKQGEWRGGGRYGNTCWHKELPVLDDELGISGWEARRIWRHIQGELGMPFSVRGSLEDGVEIAVLNELNVRFWQDLHTMIQERQLQKQGWSSGSLAFKSTPIPTNFL